MRLASFKTDGLASYGAVTDNGILIAENVSAFS